MYTVAKLLDANAAWARTVDPAALRESAQGQCPAVLWLGCSDSRVPETLITDARPGDIFVHRNIANQFHPTDDSALAVLTFAIGVLGVEHVVVAGHTQCGGAKACYDAIVAKAAVGPAESPLTRWLTPLAEHVASLDDLPADPALALDHVVFENVKRQVANVAGAAPVREAWAAGKPLSVHGWVYDLASGRLKDLDITRRHT